MSMRLRVLLVSCLALSGLMSSAPAQRPGADASTYEAAYKFANSSSGLNLTSADARKFADRVGDSPFAASFLATFQKAYTFANSSSGLNLTSSDARTLAERFASRPDGAAIFDAYQKAYTFANSSSGMNLTSSDARSVAEKRSGLLVAYKPPTSRPAGSAASEPRKVLSRVEAIKTIADLSATLGAEQKAADALIEQVSGNPPLARAEADARLRALADRLRAKLTELDKVTLQDDSPKR